MDTSERSLFALDTPEPVRINSEECYLRGWYLPETPDSTIEVKVNGVSFPVYSGIPRGDVVRHYNRPDAFSCGFVARFDVARERTSRVQVIARNRSEEVVLATKIVPALSNRTVPQTYSDWIIDCEPALFWPKREIADRLALLPYRPLISVLLPLYNTHSYLLRRCIESVLNQHYGFWQLLIVENYSDDPGLLGYLEQIAAEDSRVQIAKSDSVEKSAACNLALEAAHGDLLVLLDPTDELHPYALLEVVRLLNQNGRPEIVYSDEDRIDLYGQRSHPCFKPEFDIDMFLSSNYLARLVAFRREAIRSLGGFRTKYEGAHEWDLMIRLVERFGAASVGHIAKPLYHSRVHQDAASISVESRSGAAPMQEVAKEHIGRTGKRAVIEPGLDSKTVRWRWAVTRDTKIAVFMRAEDGALQISALEPCIDSRHMTMYQIIGCAVQRLTRPAGHIYTLNDICEQVIVFINRPLENVNHAFFNELVAQTLRSECGLVTGLSIGLDRRVIHAGLVEGPSGELIDAYKNVLFPEHAFGNPLALCRTVHAISDEFFAIRREHLAAIGGLSVISSSHMPRVVRLLAHSAKSHNLRILVTPYAIATFEDARPSLPWEPLETQDRSRLNPSLNFAVFQNSGESLATS